MTAEKTTASQTQLWLAHFPPPADPLIGRLAEEMDQSVDNLRRVAREWISGERGSE